MTPERRMEIRRAAAVRCAAQLNATVTEDGPGSQTGDDWPDAEEREVFSDAVTRIVRRLYREGYPQECGRRPGHVQHDEYRDGILTHCPGKGANR